MPDDNQALIWPVADEAPFIGSIFPEASAQPGRIATAAGDLRYINLRGDLEACARQLGQRTAEASRRGALPFYSQFVSAALAKTPARFLRQTLSRTTRQLVTRRMARRLPTTYRRALAELARELGMEERELLDAHLLPETLASVELAWSRARAKYPLRAAIGPTQCAQIVRLDQDGAILHGRNLDFAGGNLWERYTTAAIYHPDDGLSYVAITSAGFLGAGALAMNAAGLTIAAKPLGGTALDLDGIPFGVATEAVMRGATDIDAAIAILRDHPPVGGWRYTMTEGDTGRAMRFEISPHHQQRQLLALEKHAPCSREQVATWLANGDKQRETTRQTALLDPTAAGVTTIGAVIFEPAARRVWIAAGATPTPRGWFVPITLTDRNDGGPDLDVSPFCIDPEWPSSARGKAFELYRQACWRHLEGESAEHTLIKIEHALAHMPEDADLQILTGLLALKSNREERAHGALRRAMELRMDDGGRRAEVALYLAWALDLKGQRLAAKSLYKQLLGDKNTLQEIKALARLSRWRPFDKGSAREIEIDFYRASALPT
ncbi:MAG: C45 family autoproteolytic acyltransferase/hydrolase [Myxococcota bacterium]|nr:C45 family autoproteolytic acyltransferase/hydrolase [Myxococcota bacterium]